MSKRKLNLLVTEGWWKAGMIRACPLSPVCAAVAYPASIREFPASVSA